jgi:hypothetical protein
VKGKLAAAVLGALALSVGEFAVRAAHAVKHNRRSTTAFTVISTSVDVKYQTRGKRDAMCAARVDML